MLTPPRLERHEFAVGAHAQEGQEHAQHACHGNDQQHEEGHKVEKQQRGVCEAKVEPQKQFAQLQAPSYKDER